MEVWDVIIKPFFPYLIRWNEVVASLKFADLRSWCFSRPGDLKVVCTAAQKKSLYIWILASKKFCSSGLCNWVMLVWLPVRPWICCCTITICGKPQYICLKKYSFKLCLWKKLLRNRPFPRDVVMMQSVPWLC